MPIWNRNTFKWLLLRQQNNEQRLKRIRKMIILWLVMILHRSLTVECCITNCFKLWHVSKNQCQNLVLMTDGHAVEIWKLSTKYKISSKILNSSRISNCYDNCCVQPVKQWIKFSGKRHPIFFCSVSSENLGLVW